MDKIQRIKELIELLNKANDAYYNENTEIMSNLEYDKLYDELSELEKETGVLLSNSPTINVGYNVKTGLSKIEHEEPMLSLDKTKEVDALREFLGDKEGVLSFKLDGLTVVLKYRDGNLYQGITRGSGEIGELITDNVRMFKNIPLSIAYKGELTIRGEAVIKYSDFEMMNSKLLDEAKYKNPRNLCSGSVRQLNNKITAERNVHFYAFGMVSNSTNLDFKNISDEYEFLKEEGFQIVRHKIVNADNIKEKVLEFSEEIADFDIPSDGLVLMFNDILYGKSLGRTAKFPKNGIAFKWKDETALTKLIDIEWSPSRTGLINPIAIFEPVELEGTTVSRASVHNLSMVLNLELGIGDEIEVYKANMIIPQILENHTRTGNVMHPKSCPACGEETIVKSINENKMLYCPNEKCVAKHVKKFAHFVSRDAFNIEGLSEETLEKLIDKGLIHEYKDIFRIEEFRDVIVEMSGFGEKSYENFKKSIDKSRKILLPKLIYSLGILNIGLSNAKVICKHFDNDLDKMINLKVPDLIEVEGIGEIIAASFVNYFENSENRKEFNNLLSEINIDKPELEVEDSDISGKTFVITGSVNHFANRNEIKDIIEKKGGKVSSSVTKKTDYLINNDINSSSSKNKAAKENNVPIITEEDFMKLIL